jgi:hypothetical protein
MDSSSSLFLAIRDLFLRHMMQLVMKKQIKKASPRDMARMRTVRVPRLVVAGFQPCGSWSRMSGMTVGSGNRSGADELMSG